MITIWSCFALAVIELQQWSYLVLVFCKIVYVQQEDTVAISRLIAVRDFFFHTQPETQLLIVSLLLYYFIFISYFSSSHMSLTTIVQQTYRLFVHYLYSSTCKFP